MTATIANKLSFTDQRDNVYSCGPWNGEFGCWELSRGEHQCRQSFPYWPVITRKGDVLGPKTLLENQAWFKAQMLYAPYDPLFLVDLPKWLTLPKIVYAVAQYRKCDYSLERIIPPCVLGAEGNLRKRLVQSLRHVNDLHELESLLARWSQKIYIGAQFPEPPFPGNSLLKPIRSGEELRKEGLLMENCVAGYAQEVADGNLFRAVCICDSVK